MPSTSDSANAYGVGLAQSPHLMVQWMQRRSSMGPAGSGGVEVIVLMEGINPYRVRRHLSQVLRGARLRAGLTTAAVADRVGVPEPIVIAVETGLVHVGDADSYATVYGLSGQLAELRDSARQSESDPWRDYGGILTRATFEYFRREASADILRGFQGLIIPGLLQTPEYTRCLLTDAFGFSADVVAQHVDLREQRQQFAFGGDLRIRYILEESVVRRQVGDAGVMQRQLDHIVSLAEEDAVQVQVLSLGSGVSFSARGPFVLLDYLGEPALGIVYFEGSAGERVLNSSDTESLPYQLGFDLLASRASDPANVREELERLSF